METLSVFLSFCEGSPPVKLSKAIDVGLDVIFVVSLKHIETLKLPVTSDVI